MQYASKSNVEALNARSTAPSSAWPEHARRARAFWLGEARRSIRFARGWRCLFGGPLHHLALGMYLEYLLDADTYRSWARGAQ